MAKAVDLLSYWMPALRQIREFREVAKAEEPEIIALLEAAERTLANMFIETADEAGITRFERMMGITPDDSLSLEMRRLNVQILWNSNTVYTENTLYNSLVTLCDGEDKFTITEHYKDYWLEVETQLGVNGSFDAVVAFLKKILPCNLVLEISNVLKESSKTTTVHIVGVTSAAMRYLITNDIKGSINTYTASWLRQKG